MPARPDLFADIDSMDPDRYASHLADDVWFRFGSWEPVVGRDAVRETWRGFCEGLAGVSHELLAQWEDGGATVAEANVTYTRRDGSTVTLPVVTIYRSERDDGLIEDYRIYMDVAPLFAAG